MGKSSVNVGKFFFKSSVFCRGKNGAMCRNAGGAGMAQAGRGIAGGFAAFRGLWGLVGAERVRKGQGLERWSGTAGGQGLKVYTVGIHMILICIFVCGHSPVGLSVAF